MLLPAFIVSLAKHSPVQLGEKAFTKGRTFCVVEYRTIACPQGAAEHIAACPHWAAFFHKHLHAIYPSPASKGNKVLYLHWQSACN